MDFLWDLLSNVEKSAFYLALQRLAPIDWIVIFFILFGMLQGSKRGLIEMFSKVIEMTIIIVLTLIFYPIISKALVTMIPAMTSEMAGPLVFIPFGLFAWFSISWGFNMIGKVFRVEVSSFLKFIGGVIFGGIYCAMLLSFLVQVVLFIPATNIQKAFTSRGSYAGEWIAKLAPGVHHFVLSPFLPPDNIDKKKPAA